LARLFGRRARGVEKQNLSGYINGQKKKVLPSAGFWIKKHAFCEAKRAKWVWTY